MRKERTLDNIYLVCTTEGSFVPLAKVEEEKIKTMLNVALMDFETVQDWAKKAPKNSGQWNAIYKLHYDVLHLLAEAFIRFDKIKAKTHECLFAYLCDKHSDLELDWNFFEKVRTKRNRSLYYGEAITHKDWITVQLQLTLYINTLKKAVEEKLS